MCCIINKILSLMRNDIENFITSMTDILNDDMIKYIIQNYVYRKHNRSVIAKQKELKYKMLIEIRKLFNILYFDRNFVVYLSVNNQVMLENLSMVYNNVHIYSNTVQSNAIPNIPNLHNEYQQLANNLTNSENHLMQSATFDNSSNNELVLYNHQQQTQQLYDENGLPIQRRVRMYVVYT